MELEKAEVQARSAEENLKHILAPSQTLIKPHTESLMPSVPITQYITPGFQQQKITRQEKAQSERRNQASKQGSAMSQTWALSDNLISNQ